MKHLLVIPSSLAILILPLTSCSSFSRGPGSAPTDSLTIRRIFDDPSLEGQAPRALKFSPDGSRVTFLKGKLTDSKTLDLWDLDTRTKQQRMLVDSAVFLKGKEENLSAEEKAQRERRRISSSGIIEYDWSESGNALVFPIGGALYFYPIGSSERHAPVQLTSGKFHETDSHLSPQGNFISFVRNSNLYLMPTKTRKERRITSDGSKTVKNGMAEFIAQEEMGRYDGQWWSKDERFLAFTRTDESGVEVSKRYEINADDFAVEEQRYPRTGTPNAKVRLGVLDLKTSRVRWLDLGRDSDIYLTRVTWLPDHRTVAAQVESRNQKKLDLVFFDVLSGKKQKILTESDEHWINLEDDLRYLKKSNRFVWSSERGGTRQLYLYQKDGKLLRQLTHQAWPVQGLLDADDDEKYVYYAAPGKSPLESQLFQVSLDSGEETQITTEEGEHAIRLAKGAQTYIDTYSNPSQPPQVSLHSINGKRILFLEENLLDEKHPLAPYLSRFSQPEFGSFQSKSGVELYYRLLKPKNYARGHLYPVIVDVYGGPTRQYVQKGWAGKRGLWHQYMASRGFVILTVENRGTPGRNRGFENAIYHQLGNVEVEDQKAGVDFLIAQKIADPKRVGIIGWSYGGYMTLMCMLKAADTFLVGVSVAPVSDWALYDTHYTERYLGTPAENPKGYEESSVLKYAGNLKGRLLMVHGMADDNVLFTNSTKVYKAFQDKALPFDMMAYPGSKHGIYGKMLQTHLFEKLSRYFEENLSRY